MSVDIMIYECNDYRGKWAAHLYEARDMDQLDESILQQAAGYGATPLEAAASLMAMAANERKRREP